jgi:hypothetical protein
MKKITQLFLKSGQNSCRNQKCPQINIQASFEKVPKKWPKFLPSLATFQEKINKLGFYKVAQINVCREIG